MSDTRNRRDVLHLVPPMRPMKLRRPAGGRGLLFPLDVAYAHAGAEPPQAHTIAPEQMPEPYRSLLVHENDMTPTLERHFGGPVVLRVLSAFTNDQAYVRRILLVQEYSGRPVEMGALCLDLSAFKPRVRAEIIRGERPFSTVLRDHGLAFASQPTRFLTAIPNSEMLGVFWMREPLPLFGRQTNVVLDGRKIGYIVEILPRM